MAVTKIGKQWCGVQRQLGNGYIETCYNLYMDPDDSSIAAYLRVSGICIYAETEAELLELLPASIQIDIGEDSYQYSADGNVMRGAYSPSGNWMPFYSCVYSTAHMDIPTDLSTFTLDVSVAIQETVELSFTETGHRPVYRSMTVPERMYTGTPYEFQFDSTVPAGGLYRSTASLTWFPKATGYYTTQIYESGYYDANTKLDDAESWFSSVYFAVANRDSLPGAQAALLTANAQVVVQTVYLSDSFTGGCAIMELQASVPVSPRDEVDASLAPVITGVAVSASPAEAVINGQYVHRQASLTFTPTVQYKYGDTLSYLNSDVSGYSYANSVSVQAGGVTPGESYVRPDTGDTETAGETSVRGISITATGAKWKLASSVYDSYYTVLYYHYPRFESFSIHRCTTSTAATDYLYDGTYYTKDDYGAYCLIEYVLDFSSLDGENETEFVIQYGTHRMEVTPGADGQGFVVVPAATTQSMNIIGILYDNYIPYGVAFQQRLSTAGILMDFLAGGKGMAFGKKATEANALDISPDWSLLFYQATVGAYSGTTRQDLVSWMHDIDTRLTALESS